MPRWWDENIHPNMLWILKWTFTNMQSFYVFFDCILGIVIQWCKLYQETHVVAPIYWLQFFQNLQVWDPILHSWKHNHWQHRYFFSCSLNRLWGRSTISTWMVQNKWQESRDKKSIQNTLPSTSGTYVTQLLQDYQASAPQLHRHRSYLDAMYAWACNICKEIYYIENRTLENHNNFTTTSNENI